TEADYEAVWRARRALEERAREPLPGGLSAVPDEPLPPIGTLGFRVQRYGMLRWSDLFTARQKLALMTVTRAVRNVSDATLREVLGAVVSRCADYWSAGVVWAQEGEFVAHTFGRQALPIVWDFAETNPWAGASGNFDGAVEWVASVITAIPSIPGSGQTQLA